MKKLSETLAENGIAFSFPIQIKDDSGNETYFESSDGYWRKREYDANGSVTYFEDSGGYWSKTEFDANGNVTYYESSTGYWHKREYDVNGEETYYEDSVGFWSKRQYNANGNETYYEDSDGCWQKREYDANGNETYYEDSDGYWQKREYDANGNETYYEDSDGLKRGTSKAQSCDGISATLDDKAWETAQFVQKLCEVQNQYFDRLVDKAEEKWEWYNGMDVETFTDHLFDYVFNTPSRNGHPELMFSEYIEHISTFNNSGTGVIDKNSQTEPLLRYDT